MIQNNEINPSYVPNPAGQHYRNSQPLNLVSNSNQQSVPSALCNPPKQQNNTQSATKQSDIQFVPQHQNWSYAQAHLSAKFAGYKPMPHYRQHIGQTDYNAYSGYYQGQLSHSNVPQMQLHQTPYQILQQIPPQMTPQGPISPHLSMPMPLNTFNPYGITYPNVRYGASSGETKNPYRQLLSNQVQAMQNISPSTFQVNQNDVPSPVISHSYPGSSYEYTTPQSSHQHNPNPFPFYSQPRTAVNTLSALADTPGLKRRIGANGEFSSLKIYKRQKTLTSTDDDDNLPSSPYSPKSNDEEEDSASSTSKDDNQIYDKKLFDASHVVDIKDDFSCVICQETKKDTVLFPCRHLCVCKKCSDAVSLCPLCRNDFFETLTVFT
ncbi:uncharacterized protein LOC119071638 [Bradysia coprophila]|uniref:uncharacterized protein LOC119071638 n=1 Tax=Bradysia coprophila TaxID=38358 RepID=UPI00187DA475|nr:uncharacterized protein LOC119071638 [Bradysia coprophila]